VYRERRSSLVPGTVWEAVGGDGQKASRVLPDGCMDLLWTRDQLWAAGPDTEVLVVASGPGERTVGLRFDPGIGPLALGIPAYPIRNQVVPLEDLWDPVRARRAASDLGRGGLRALEAVCAEAADDGPLALGPWGPAESTAVARAAAAALPLPVAARRVGFSERSLRRYCHEVYGYGFATLRRILRFTRAVQLVEAGRPLASVADLAGYADQAHMSREFGAFAGTAPGRLSDAA